MKRFLEGTADALCWTAVIVVLLLLLPFWLAKYLYRSVTVKNRRPRGFLRDEEGDYD